MKDYFSKQSVQYAKFRPVYPGSLYSFLLPLLEHKRIAWDCGTGNGQVANELAKHFDKVYATDISQHQLDNAIKKHNIIYQQAPAENSGFPNNSFDLITVAQAIHWFDFNAFYREVIRTMLPNGILTVIGYGLFQSDKNTDTIINNFYTNIIGPYWDKERKYIDEKYQSIPFPFKEIESFPFINEYQWSFDQFIGFLGTWSAVQHYIKEKGDDPVQLIYDHLKEGWGNKPLKSIRFSLFLRIGKVEK